MRTDDICDGLWARVNVPGMKPHLCPRKLVPGLLTDLQTRTGSPDAVVGSCETGFIDLPGMIMMNRPIEKIKIDTLSLEIPSQDFEWFVRETATVPERKFIDGQRYFKIHGWLTCVVFTPEQRDLMLQAMEDLLPQALERAEEADRRFSEGLRKINEGEVKVVSFRDKESPHVRLVPPPVKDKN